MTFSLRRPEIRLATCLVLAFALALGAGVADAANTPLGKWMKANMGAPLAAEDFPTLAKSFDALASSPPPGRDYAQWSSTAKAGGAATVRQDAARVKQACKQCHDLYREKYKKEFPSRPFP
jgi:hypothetical protein